MNGSANKGPEVGNFLESLKISLEACVTGTRWDSAKYMGEEGFRLEG